MRISKKKIIVIAGIAGIAILIGIHLAGYLTVFEFYTDKYEGMEDIEKGIYHLADDGYVYTVAMPKIIHIEKTKGGNLAVSTADDKYSLLIWPVAFGNIEYGVSIYVDEYESYTILLDQDRNPIQEADADILAQHEAGISGLFERADARWQLKDLL